MENRSACRMSRVDGRKEATVQSYLFTQTIFIGMYIQKTIFISKKWEKHQVSINFDRNY